MAGDWIKVENCLHDKPEIWSIANEIDIDPDAVVGKLLRIWIWFDEQSAEGNAPSVTKMLLDRQVGVTGFCDHIIQAGWMSEDGDTITLTNFDRHNGRTAKTRALTAKRVANFKSNTNAPGNAPVTVDALPREEKRRVKEPSSPAPKKTGRKRFCDYTEQDMFVATLIFNGVSSLTPDMRQPNLPMWANEIRLMRERDGRTHEQIEVLFTWSNDDDFWHTVILGPVALREKWETLSIKMKMKMNGGSKRKNLPSLDELLPDFAKKNGLPKPMPGEGFPQYRHRLRIEMEKSQ